MKPRSIAVSTAIFFALFFGSFQMLTAQEIGLELYSLRNQFKTDVPGTLAKIKSWGIKEIEGGGTYGLSMDEYKKLLEQNGLKMVSIGVDFDNLQRIFRTPLMKRKRLAQDILCVSGFPIMVPNSRLMISKRQ